VTCHGVRQRLSEGGLFLSGGSTGRGEDAGSDDAGNEDDTAESNRAQRAVHVALMVAVGQSSTVAPSEGAEKNSR
jgi:hypothetical protein